MNGFSMYRGCGLENGPKRLLFLVWLLLLLSACDQVANKTASPSTQQTNPVPGQENPYRNAADQEAHAIKLAREGRTLVAGQVFAARPDPAVLTNDFQIRTEMSKVKGDLRIEGWKARKIDDDTYLVTYSYEHNGIGRGWPFEVKLSVGVVRNVVGDRELEGKYGWGGAR